MKVLDMVQFPWKLDFDERWSKNYQDLVAFHRIHGHCKVSRVSNIGDCVAHQRREMKKYHQGKKSCLREERIKTMYSLGFEYNVRLDNWDDNFQKFLLFKQTHGHCSVPWEHVTLVRWARYQQVCFAKMSPGEGYKMTEKEIEKLKSVGFWGAE